jgi:hypothetical protein
MKIPEKGKGGSTDIDIGIGQETMNGRGSIDIEGEMMRMSDDTNRVNIVDGTIQEIENVTQTGTGIGKDHTVPAVTALTTKEGEITIEVEKTVHVASTEKDGIAIVATTLLTDGSDARGASQRETKLNHISVFYLKLLGIYTIFLRQAGLSVVQP